MFSIIIPVYNRPDEIDELLQSLTVQTYTDTFEVVIIEDGSSTKCEHLIKKYSNLDITYFFKANSGPGDSRNFGMRKAKGNYFIILDSDCILPENYLQAVNEAIEKNQVDCFGGPDAALSSFSNIQKAINFTMTSFLTTGGIRGGSESISQFQPRSFNMGLSKKAFEASGGFGNIHPGEDPDLSIRLWKLGFKTSLIKTAYVYHKRRIDWNKFYTQVNKFGMVRPILNAWHPAYRKITYWFPTVFMLGLLLSMLFTVFKFPYFLYCYVFYYFILFNLSLIKNKSITVAFYSVIASVIQFFGYGFGFLKSYFVLNILNKVPEKVFPKLFFKIDLNE